MRIMYVGMDNCTRVAQTNRVKFLENGFPTSYRHSDFNDGISGPVIIAHVYRSKGGKRLTLAVPDSFDMARAQQELLKDGWLDLTECVTKGETLY